MRLPRQIGQWLGAAGRRCQPVRRCDPGALVEPSEEAGKDDGSQRLGGKPESVADHGQRLLFASCRDDDGKEHPV